MSSSRRSGFTLIEMLLASVLSALLIGGMVFMLGGLGRDRARLQMREAGQQRDHFMELLRWDLANATKVLHRARGEVLALEGYGAIDRNMLTGTNRLVRIGYRIAQQGSAFVLLRDQTYLDDPVRREPWTDVVANGVTRLYISAQEEAEFPGAEPQPPADLVHVRMELGRAVLTQDLRVR